MPLLLFRRRHHRRKIRNGNIAEGWKINFMIIQFVFIKNLNKKIEIIFTIQSSSKLLKRCFAAPIAISISI